MVRLFSMTLGKNKKYGNSEITTDAKTSVSKSAGISPVIRKSRKRVTSDGSKLSLLRSIEQPVTKAVERPTTSKRMTFSGGEILTNVKHEFSQRISRHTSGTNASLQNHGTNAAPVVAHTNLNSLHNNQDFPRKVTRADIVAGVYRNNFSQQLQQKHRRCSNLIPHYRRNNNNNDQNNNSTGQRFTLMRRHTINTEKPLKLPSTLTATTLYEPENEEPGLPKDTSFALRRLSSNHSTYTQHTTGTDMVSLKLVFDTEIGIGMRVPMVPPVY